MEDTEELKNIKAEHILALRREEERCVSVLLDLTLECKCILWSYTAFAACRWALSHHTCVPVTSCRVLGLVGKHQMRHKRGRSHIRASAHFYAYRNTHRRHTPNSCCALLSKHKHSRGNLSKIHLYNVMLLFSSSQFLILPKCPHFCSHIFWRTEPC